MSDIKYRELVIKIPEKEFGREITDKFQDFFKRLKAEIKGHLIGGTALVCGAYELETVEMFLNAFANTIPLPKEHGRLKDTDAICKDIISALGIRNENYLLEAEEAVYKRINNAPTIIEEDKTESEKA